jgi:hypothetical protein
MSEGVRIQQRNVGSSLLHSLSPRGRQRQFDYLALATLGYKQPSVAVFVIAFLGRLLCQASGYEIGFRGGRPLLERGGKKPETQIETIYRGENRFERFAWRGALEGPRPVSGINTVLVPGSSLHWYSPRYHWMLHWKREEVLRRVVGTPNCHPHCSSCLLLDSSLPSAVCKGFVCEWWILCAAFCTLTSRRGQG